MLVKASTDSNKPKDDVISPLLTAEPMDLSNDYKTQCSGMFYDVKANSSEFCLNSVFSLSSIFNDGALACDCDGQGSISKYCQEFGGQCPCKPDVIGRQCTQCKVGYYGFPNCKRMFCFICFFISLFLSLCVSLVLPKNFKIIMKYFVS